MFSRLSLLPRYAASALHKLGAPRRAARWQAWNTKVFGTELARQYYIMGLAGPNVALPTVPVLQGLGGQICRQADIESEWLRFWCGQLHCMPLYHRKLWEDCFAVQALWEAEMLQPGRRGLGFAVGVEHLPAYLASQGVEVVATDLDIGDVRAAKWVDTDQHGNAPDRLFQPDLVARADFDRLVTLRAADMVNIPPDLAQGGFDFVWSVCALEHLGTIEAGLRFIEKAMDSLKPGGVAVHTTEFNIDPDGPTISRGTTVLFQRRHIEELGRRLAAKGHTLLPVDFDPGQGVLDGFIDLPPYPYEGGPLRVPDAPHLKLSVLGYAATSIGLIVRKAA
ncbi:SAM-dependent methyltransferase [Humitalea sp. 24SJ18S-53]|uniref:SAM-dependent methyltransferase n=1 Tax=Humitalea sp. 24SJ18S-53 TaxID=3422307 RepID=UPI003D67724A